jgi:hypothetical protein
MQQLAQALEANGYAQVLEAVAALSEKERKGAAGWLAAQWKERAAAKSPEAPRWWRQAIAMTALAADAKKALALALPHSGTRYGIAWDTDQYVSPPSAEATATLAQAAIDRGREWCAKYLDLLCDAKTPRPTAAEVPLVIARAHALPLPATPILAEVWATQFFMLLQQPHAARDDPTAPFTYTAAAFELHRGDGRWQVRGRDLMTDDAPSALRQMFDCAPMLLQLFEHRDAIHGIAGRYLDQDALARAMNAIAALLADGTVDRAALAHAAIAALSRGDSVGCQRLQARVLELAQPSPTLVDEHARVLVNVMGSASSVPAGAAQSLLRTADAVVPLADDLFVDACQIVFARKEKGLREQQLAWARQRAEAVPTASTAVMGMAQALSCGDHPLQKQAAQAIVAAWPRLDAAQRGAVLALIADSRDQLDAAVFESLWTACAGTPAVEAAPTSVPHVPVARPGLNKQPFEPVPDPTRLPAEVMQALQVWQCERDAYQHERAIQAMVDARVRGLPFDDRLLVVGQPWAMHTWSGGPDCRDLSRIAMLRLKELLAASAPHAHLSTPTWRHGAIAPADLVQRLTRFAQVGIEAKPIDFLVALLRTEPCEREHVDALRAIGSAQARIAADFLEAGGVMQLQTRWLVADGADRPPVPAKHTAKGQWYAKGRREVCVAISAAAVRPAIDGAPMEWATAMDAADAPEVSEFDMVADWITGMLPTHAEALAALHLWGFRRAGLEYGINGGKNVGLRLPMLLAADGPAGPALHLAVLFCMSANDAPVRIVGSDGLITLLQQQRFDATLAGRLLAACIGCGSVKLGRVARALTQVLEAGEADAVWALLRAGMEAALPMSPLPTGVADWLDLAVKTATALGLREDIAALGTAVEAVQGKPNKVQIQAQRLHALLSE